ncbi:hypothetical protein Rhopal_003982-T1 [Rhodotorula paludigena]|uniref:Uncharacterized protein n=1 Tax=Rhodotorula paludigena TaxID=86838 RepID=A0AAV5GQL7_9BASI|nr:hypothetical protein Rhopal_003982-T1 [Rhodotorula paludigena]
MDGPCEPRVHTHTLVLDLSRFDPAFAQPLFASLSLLSPAAAVLAVGAQPLPFAFAQDTSVAMPRPNAPPAATSISKSASASLALSSRLAKRYHAQIFLSLDLSSLGDGGGGPATADRAMLPMEKALIVALDQVLPRKRP